MTKYKCSEEMHNRCENSAICHLCDGVALYKNTPELKKAKREQKELNKQVEKSALVKNYKKEKKEGMGFEKRVASQWNQKFGSTTKKKVAKPRLDMLADEPGEEAIDTAQDAYVPTFLGTRPPVRKTTSAPKNEAKRQANSGAMWHSKGDIKLEHALMECKERGTTNARGEKQITIPKLWIEKQEKEAFQEQRPYWYIPFGYKGDDGVYLVKSYEHEMEMIYELRKAREEIERLSETIKELTKEKE